MMMHRLSVAVVLFITLYFVSVFAVDWDVQTPLDDYVHRPDPAYEYYVLDIYDEDPDFTVHVLNMTSQMWMDESFSDSPLWWHYLSIFIPKSHQTAIRDAAHIHIGNGNHNDSIPVMTDEWMERNGNFCRNTKAVTAHLLTVPYQPIVFAGYEYGKVEDFIIGHTWRIYIEDENANPDIVALLPMVKAAKMALDTIVEYTKSQDASYEISRFMPTGFSKRGWTTWLLGCVDQRVFAMAPTVFDLLDMIPNLEHHYMAYGGWSWAFFPYVYENVSQYLYHNRTAEMAGFIDPLSFNERLTMPKLIISAAGDQFFLPDDANFFYDRLTGPKFLQIWENDEHGLDYHRDQRDHNLQAFFLQAHSHGSWPTITWTRLANDVSGRISVVVNPAPLAITSWWADTTNITCEPDYDIEGTCRRDFRIRAKENKTGIWWIQEPVFDMGNNEYVIAYNVPSFGFKGFFIQMTMAGPDGYSFTFTTEMNIIPDIYPYPKCETEEECAGRIV